MREEMVGELLQRLDQSGAILGSVLLDQPISSLLHLIQVVADSAVVRLQPVDDRIER